MNDQTYVATVKKALQDCIAELDSIKWLYLMNPDKDFTRDRKITFERFINICLQMDGGALQNELMKHFDFAEDTLTKSAFCQQRAKVSSEALKFRKTGQYCTLIHSADFFSWKIQTETG